VVVAVDFSEASREAVLVAAYLAGRLGAPLTLLHVIHDPVDTPGFYSDTADEGPQRPIEAIARGLADEFLASMRREHPGLSALVQPDFMIVSGLPVTRIPEVCEHLCAGLLVIGPDGGLESGADAVGGRGTASIWHRSLSERLTRNTACPLLVAEPAVSLPGYLDRPAVRRWLASDGNHMAARLKIA
jgi:nucleotide-binding universal stress UspA family protein